MVMPRFRSSGALSMAPYSRNFAKPFSACRFVMAAVNVVYSRFSCIRCGLGMKAILFHGQHGQWFLFRSALLYNNTRALFTPIFTCGFVRWKAVASPRAPLRSLPKTCCTGLMPFCWRTASRLVLMKGTIDRDNVDMLRTEREKGTNKTLESERIRKSIRG